jgi:hypothetical protein
VCFPVGNLAPGESVIKSTSIDPSVIDADGVYRKRGPARVFVRETDAIEAVKSGTIQSGDIIVLICRGPLGSGMEEVYQLTSALKHLTCGKHVALLTDARFSGVSTGACIDAAAVSLRKKLGESLSSVEKYATPLEEATTPSLEAAESLQPGNKDDHYERGHRRGDLLPTGGGP